MSTFQGMVLRGTRAAQPGAATVPVGTLYYVTDETLLERSSGSAWQSYSAGASAGKLIQVVNTQTGAVATGATQIPVDNSIPQSGEGDEYMTLSITPTSLANKLKIEVVFHASFSIATAWMTAALFQDSVANALACSATFMTTQTAFNELSFTHYMTVPSTSAIIFKVRGGANQSGTTTFNGQSAARLFGGVLASSITISEIVP